MCQIDLVHLMSYIVYWYEPSDLAYEISHLIWHMRFTAIWGNRSTVDPIVLPFIYINSRNCLPIDLVALTRFE